jgi:hypothetical protein
MFIEDYTMLLMARERMKEASRSAEQRRALRLAESPRQSIRVRLGIALVWLGHWMMGQYVSTPRTPLGLRQARS